MGFLTGLTGWGQDVRKAFETLKEAQSCQLGCVRMSSPKQIWLHIPKLSSLWVSYYLESGVTPGAGFQP
jgi:hypothetical protein